MAIHNRQDLHAFAAFREPHGIATALGGRKRRIDEAFALVDHAVLAQRVRQLRENVAQNFAFTPLLESAVHRFVVGIALRQHVPLRPGVQDPEHGLQDRAGRHRLATGTTVQDVFLGKMVPNPFPLVVAQAQRASAL